MSDTEVPGPISMPPDWRDWINEFPTMKALAIFCFVSWNVTPVEMTVVGWLIGNGFISGKEEIDAVLSLIDKWLDALNILTWAAVFGVVTKFATTKAEVIRAEGEVKAKTIVAAAQAEVVKSTGTFPVSTAPAPVPVPVPVVESSAPSKTDSEAGL